MHQKFIKKIIKKYGNKYLSSTGIDIRNSVDEKVTEFREIPRNFTELIYTEFTGIPAEF